MKNVSWIYIFCPSRLLTRKKAVLAMSVNMTGEVLRKSVGPDSLSLYFMHPRVSDTSPQMSAVKWVEPVPCPASPFSQSQGAMCNHVPNVSRGCMSLSHKI